jgi:hypothetical protein
MAKCQTYDMCQTGNHYDSLYTFVLQGEHHAGLSSSVLLLCTMLATHNQQGQRHLLAHAICVKPWDGDAPIVVHDTSRDKYVTNCGTLSRSQSGGQS